MACDNAGVVASIREGSMGSYGHIVLEIRARSNDFRFVEFIHEGRRSNVDAHNLVIGVVLCLIRETCLVCISA